MKLKKKMLIHTDFLTMFVLLQAGVYSYEYIYDWEKFKGASLTEKDFYSNLNMEEVRADADADYPLTKKFVKILK